MRRFVLIVPSYYPSDERPIAGIFVRQQAQALSEHCDVAVVHVTPAKVAAPPTLVVEDGIVVVRATTKEHRIPRQGPARFLGYIVNLYLNLMVHPRLGLRAFELLRQSRRTPDILHVHGLWPASAVASAIQRRHGIPYVVTEHSSEYFADSSRKLAKSPMFVERVLRPLALRAAKTIAVSRVLADRLADLGLAVDPVVIPNVVPGCPPQSRARRPLPGQPHLIVHASVMGPEKNIAGLLEACSQLAAQRSDFRLILVGDGELREDLQRKAVSLGLGDRVEFTGEKSPDEVFELLRSAAFAVVSSTQETFSVAAAEALMCGRPVLATRCGGPEGFITPEVGLLIDKGSVEALLYGLGQMLDNHEKFDPVALNRYAIEHFSSQAVVMQICEVYEGVLGAGE